MSNQMLLAWNSLNVKKLPQWKTKLLLTVTFQPRMGCGFTVQLLPHDWGSMKWGGGTTLRDSFSFERWAGPGHNSVFKDDDGKIYLVYHAYDRNDEGHSKLMLEEITFASDGRVLL